MQLFDKIKPPHWKWMLMFIVFICQLFSIIQIHSNFGHLVIWDTIFLLIIRLDESPILENWFQKQNTKLQQPFLHVIGCITTAGLLFVAFIHGLEASFCDKPNSHLTTSFLVTTIINVILKILMIFYFQIKLLKIIHQCILHLLVPAGIIMLYSVNYFYSPQSYYYLSNLDPWLTMAFCVFIIIIIIPVFFHHMQCLLCHSPDGIQIDKFKEEIEKKFPSTRCLHLHIFRSYPNAFDIIMHIAIINLIYKSDETDVDKLPQNINLKLQLNEKEQTIEFKSLNINNLTNVNYQKINEMLKELQNVLQKTGAQKITIQPHFLNLEIKTKNSNALNFVQNWNICKTLNCSTEKGCCAF